jgi:hypothetical protein
MSLIDNLKTKYQDNLMARCEESNCKLRLNGCGNYLILKGEELLDDQKICDCIVITENIIIGIVELKSKSFHASEIVEKMYNTSIVALNILNQHKGCLLKYKLCHMILAKSYGTSEYRVLSTRKLTIAGRRYSILPKRCGVTFSNIISNL